MVLMNHVNGRHNLGKMQFKFEVVLYVIVLTLTVSRQETQAIILAGAYSNIMPVMKKLQRRHAGASILMQQAQREKALHKTETITITAHTKATNMATQTHNI